MIKMIFKCFHENKEIAKRHRAQMKLMYHNPLHAGWHITCIRLIPGIEVDACNLIMFSSFKKGMARLTFGPLNSKVKITKFAKPIFLIFQGPPF